jgi:hypothetical protein
MHRHGFPKGAKIKIKFLSGEVVLRTLDVLAKYEDGSIRVDHFGDKIIPPDMYEVITENKE